ncbi:hypothetical protein [Ferrovum sp.]|uniref:hypothetical protein n=1 Tax=Ferrovum sp. TaxID=2609467 RepID=UPI002630E5AA|nr:hypothetical protein [Ferrovum sp.]
MVFDKFEMGGIVAIALEVLALVISIVMIRHFNKQIRQKKQKSSLADQSSETHQ